MTPPRRLVFGVGPVRELLRAGRQSVTALWVSRARVERGEKRGAKDAADPVAELVADARRAGLPVELREPAELDAAAGPGGNHQGVIAVAGAYAYADLEDVLAAVRAAATPALVVALDGVTDPYNLGAVARSAFLFGATAILLPRDRSAEVTAVAVKASAGATEHIPIARVTNLVRALGELKQAGVWIAALSGVADALPLWRLDGALPLCVVLGAEGGGLRPLVEKQADYRVGIPMHGAAVGSFNVSVAAAVALYEIARQRAR